MNFKVPAHIQARVVHDEIVILDTRTDAYHALNAAAALIWAVLSEGGSSEVATVVLATRFGILPETAEVDVAVVIDDLTALGLLDRETA